MLKSKLNYIIPILFVTFTCFTSCYMISNGLAREINPFSIINFLPLLNFLPLPLSYIIIIISVSVMVWLLEQLNNTKYKILNHLLSFVLIPDVLWDFYQLALVLA